MQLPAGVMVSPSWQFTRLVIFVSFLLPFFCHTHRSTGFEHSDPTIASDKLKQSTDPYKTKNFHRLSLFNYF